LAGDGGSPEQAFDAYSVGRGVCLLIVRDNKAVISINALR